MKKRGQNEVTGVKEALTKQMGEAKGSLRASLGQLLMKVPWCASLRCPDRFLSGMLDGGSSVLHNHLISDSNGWLSARCRITGKS